MDGSCYFFPAATGAGVLGDACEFGDLNVGAGACGACLACIGMISDTDSCADVGECSDVDYPSYLNADCSEGGFCGLSFCSELCDAGACPQGFDPVTDSYGNCFCQASAPGR